MSIVPTVWDLQIVTDVVIVTVLAVLLPVVSQRRMDVQGEHSKACAGRKVARIGSVHGERERRPEKPPFGREGLLIVDCIRCETGLECPALASDVFFADIRMKGASMCDLRRSFFRCQSGAVISAELVVVGTMVVVGLITGLSAVQNSINSELVDLSSAFNSLDQSYGYVGYESVLKNRKLAWTAPSSWHDTDEQFSGMPMQVRPVNPGGPARGRESGATNGGGPVRGQRPSGNTESSRGAPGPNGRGGPSVPGRPGGSPGGPPNNGRGRGGPNADASAEDSAADTSSVPDLQAEQLEAAGQWQTTQFAPGPFPPVQNPPAPYSQPQYPQPQYPQAVVPGSVPGPVYYTWSGTSPVYALDPGADPDSYYSPSFEGYRRYSLGGREMITYVRRQRISEWPLSPWPGQNGWLSSPQEYAAPRARYASQHGPAVMPPAHPHILPAAPQAPLPPAVVPPVPGPPQHVPNSHGPATSPPPVPDGHFSPPGPATVPPPVPQPGIQPQGHHTPTPHPDFQRHPQILQAAHAHVQPGRYQVPRQSRLYNAPSWYVAPPNQHQPRFPEYVW